MIARIASLRSAKLYAALGVALSCATHAQDWPQWRGPNRDGVVPATHAPKSWPDSLRRVWRVEIGEGYSSPIVAEGRVFVHSRRDPEELVTALELANGKIIWQEKYPAAFEKNRYATKMAKGPSATPLIAGNRLFTLGVTGVLTTWDATTGRMLWRNDFSKTVETSKLFCGTAASTLLHDDRIVVQVGSDIHGGKILSLDPANGATKWEWRGHGPGYASPVVFNISGTLQIVTMTDSSIIGLDAKSGKQLWYVPFLDDWHENITTPLWTGALLIVSGTRQGTHAYTLEQRNGQWQVNEVWHNNEVAMYMSSPVLGDGLIYGHSVRQKGQFVALDAKAGVIRWATEGREGWHASVLLAPQHVLFLTNGGELVVAQRNPDAFEVERRYQVAQSEIFAMPALLGDDLLVRDVSGISRWSVRR